MLDRPIKTSERLVLALERHGQELMKVARRLSYCEDDAQDAFQRAVEIFLRRGERVPAGAEFPWLVVVLKREALHVRRTRQRMLATDEGTLEMLTGPGSLLEDRVSERALLRQAAEALKWCSPQQAEVIALRAEGHSYEEIASALGWSRRKVNRVVTEGRKRFKHSFAAIDSGDVCDTTRALFPALAMGTARETEAAAARSHLRNCVSCRERARLRTEAGFGIDRGLARAA